MLQADRTNIPPIAKIVRSFFIVSLQRRGRAALRSRQRLSALIVPLRRLTLAEAFKMIVRLGDRRGTGLPIGGDRFITVEDFARIARVSRRMIGRYRRERAAGFPKEYDVSRGRVSRPQFKLADVLAWTETRAPQIAVSWSRNTASGVSKTGKFRWIRPGMSQAARGFIIRRSSWREAPLRVRPKSFRS